MTARKWMAIGFRVGLLGMVVAGIVTSSGGASSVATASSHSCALSPHQQRHLGASYVTSLKVNGVSCRKGRKVTKAFHECRTEGGKPQGRCHHRVLHYKCSEHRFDAVPHVQYNSRATCKRGHKVVKNTYTQNV
jgi:hypothetical protein